MSDRAPPLTLALPARCEDPLPAVEKWMLALWEASRKISWRLCFNLAPISLEYRRAESQVLMGVHVSNRILRQISLSVVPSLIPGVEVVRGDDGVFEGHDHAAVCSFRLRSPGWVELPKEVAPSGVGGIVATLGRLEDHESAVVQLMLKPTWMTTEEGRQPAFWFVGRIAARSKTVQIAQQHVRVISSAFGQFAGFNGLRISRARPMTAADLRAVNKRRWVRRLLPPGSPATASQIAGLFHPPEVVAADSRLLCSRSLKTPMIATSMPGIKLGEGRDTRGTPAAALIQAGDLLRHALIVGPSGTGKTTLLSNLARELALAGHGVTVIDPHGSLVRGLARTLPASRVADAALFSFADVEYPIALNPLRARPGMEFAAADEFVEVVERVYGSAYWGPLLDLVLRHAALAAIELGGSLLESARLLDDSYFRERALARIGNPETVRVLSQLGTTFDRRLLPAINRLQRLLGTPWLRNILGQTGRGLDFTDMFEQNRIALFDLSSIGATNARLLGSLLLLLIRQATLGRPADRVSQPQHFVLIDEASGSCRAPSPSCTTKLGSSESASSSPRSVSASSPQRTRATPSYPMRRTS